MNIHFVRRKVARGHVRVLHVPAQYQIVDIFTKGLPLILFQDFKDSLSVRQPLASTVTPQIPIGFIGEIISYFIPKGVLLKLNSTDLLNM
jgi:hypothetical protein